MDIELTNDELIALRKKHEKVADLCLKHGMTDGHTASAAIVKAITAEQIERDRKG